MKLILKILPIMIVLLLAVPATACAKEEENNNNPGTKNLAVMTIADKASFNVELADNTASRMLGLMHRESLPSDQGMLFLFPGEPEEVRFWMKDTLIPLDILYIDQSGVISHIHQNAKPMDETAIPSQGPIKAVLEINAGLTEKK